ncbi:thioredoxin [Saprospira grandis]|uniref:Thioredoxin n=1 Tax=Saprospira grandis (strain Lewin) TaxID=984262 RepID=H6L7R8_SAPGL|nr:thioredoxin [Saprospira grandis]AFC23100.1 thioredoxin [Saprospira grandis str. Lewin]WBM74874.1 thioredoxin [Saprospira grandis]
MSKFQEIISGDTPVLVDFYAVWCGPCKMMPPILKEVKDKMGDAVRIIKIDVDKNQKLSAQYGIRSIPTIMLFKNGQALWQQAGVASADQLQKVIKTHS